MAAPCPAPRARSLLAKPSFLTSLPRERETRSTVCAVLKPTKLMPLPMSNRIVIIPSTMVPLFAAKANSCRYPNMPGTSDSGAPRVPLRRPGSNTHWPLVKGAKTFVHPLASSSVMGCFWKIRAD
eukprot:6433178-Pyramimonas_sp.AAC.1